MPQAVVPALGYFTTGAVSAAIAGEVIFTATLFWEAVAVGAFSYLASEILAPDVPNYNLNDQARTQVIRSPVSPHRWIYGEAVVGGTLVYATVTDGRTDFDQEYWDANSTLDVVTYPYVESETGPAPVGTGKVTYVISDPAAMQPYSYLFVCTAAAPGGGTFDVYSEADGHTTPVATITAGGPAVTVDGVDYTITVGDVDWAVDDAWASTVKDARVDPVDGEKYLHLVIVNAAHRTDSLVSLFLNDKEVQAEWITSEGAVVGGEYAVGEIDPAEVAAYFYGVAAGGTIGQPYVVARYHTGEDDQPADPLLVASSPEWTTAHQLKGRSYTYLRLRQDRDMFPTGIPSMKFQIKGKPVYDPRDGSQLASDPTTWVYSNNAALATRDLLTQLIEVIDEEVDDTTTVAAANICDEDVVVNDAGDTQPRYRCNGSFTRDKLPVEVLGQIASSMAGTAVWQMGSWVIRPGAVEPSTFAISEDDFRGSVSYRVKPGKDSRFNTVHGTYFEPNDSWQQTDFPEVTKANYVDEDGETLTKNVTLSFCTDVMEAQRLAAIDLEVNRQGLTATLPLTLSAGIALRVWQVGTVTLDVLGWDAKEFRVKSWRLAVDADGGIGVDVTVQEYADAAYDWIYSQATEVDYAPNTSLLNPRVTPGVTGLAAAAGQNELLVAASGDIITRMKISWDDPATKAIDSTEVQYALTGTGDWVATQPVPRGVTSVWVPGVEDLQNYDIRARHVNIFGVRSAWTTITNQLVEGKTADPEDVASLTLTVLAGGIRLDWPAVSDVDVQEYIVKTGTNWETGVEVFRGASLTYTDASPVSGVNAYMVKAIDSTGHPSVNPTAASVVVEAPGGVVLYHTLGASTVNLTWQAQKGGFAIDHYEVQFGATAWQDDRDTIIAADPAYTFTPWSPDVDVLVRAVDILGTPGPESLLSLSLSVPSAPQVSSTFSGPSVVFSWTAAPGSFPVRLYNVYRDGQLIETLDSTFYSYHPSTLSESLEFEAVDNVGFAGPRASAGFTVVPPSVSGLNATVIDNNVLLRWTSVKGSLPVSGVELRRGSTWSTAEVVGEHSGNFAIVLETLGGDYTYWVAPIDSAGFYGTATSATVSVYDPPDYVLRQKWDSTLRSYSDQSYNAGLDSEGSSFEGSQPGRWVENVGAGNTFSTTPTGLLELGTAGVFTSTEVAPATGGATSLVYLPLHAGAGRFAGKTVRIRLLARPAPGNPAAGFGVAYSTNGDGNSGVLPFTPTGADWDWYEATYAVPSANAGLGDHFLGVWGDSAGSGKAIEVAQISVFPDGTDQAGPLYMLMDGFDIFEDRFTDNGWLVPQDQITAGYPIYATPTTDGSTTKARYTEFFDYGTTVPGTKITINAAYEVLSGSPTISYRISTSTDGVNYVSLGDVREVLASDFRYVKAQMFVEQEAGKRDGLVRVDSFSVRLDIKNRNDGGSAVANAGDASGTFIPFKVKFLDVESITVAPSGSTALNAVYDFTDGPDPAGFYVYLFDGTGNRVTGTVSWAARGV